MNDISYPKIASFKHVDAFRARLKELNLDLPCDAAVLSAAQKSPLAKPLEIGGFVVGNRWCIHPMEGWDGTPTGEPTGHTLRRWRHFGQSGAKLIWGGEAFAVCGSGRANPNQLGIVDDDIARAEKGVGILFESLLNAHRTTVENTDDLLIGLQLTHSGRFCKPRDKQKLEPKIAYHHPILDCKFGIAPDDDSVVLDDDEIEQIIDDFIRAARMAARVGFRFIDVKHCHGYLGHELLSAYTRPGRFGGSLENRTRFARQIIAGIKAECPGLIVGVRLSAFDCPPFKAGDSAKGEPDQCPSPYYYGFGCDQNAPMQMDLSEPVKFIHMLSKMGVRLINLSCGSPYYNPHIQRPAIFPPSDGYAPPEDPLVGVARQIDAVRTIKQACPESIVVGSGYTYLQEYLPHVAQAVVRAGWTDFVGLGRLVLSYWDMPADILSGRGLEPKRICRTFSDCTTAPRNGLISGCYPLDKHYKSSSQYVELKQKKQAVLKAPGITKS